MVDVQTVELNGVMPDMTVVAKPVEDLDSDYDVESRPSHRSLPHKKRIPRKLKVSVLDMYKLANVLRLRFQFMTFNLDDIHLNCSTLYRLVPFWEFCLKWLLVYWKVFAPIFDSQISTPDCASNGYWAKITHFYDM